MSRDALLTAVEALIDPTRVRLHRDGDTRGTWQVVPSLWDQMTAAARAGRAPGGGGSAAYASRAVIATDVVRLRIEISGAALEAATELVGRSRGSVPANLRAVAASLRDPDQVQWWVDTLTRWVAQARQRLHLDPQRSSGVRGAACPRCGAATAYRYEDGEKIRMPALGFVWEGPDDEDYHTDDDWRVSAVECRACGATWFRGVAMHSLVIATLDANTARETLAEHGGTAPPGGDRRGGSFRL